MSMGKRSIAAYAIGAISRTVSNVVIRTTNIIAKNPTTAVQSSTKLGLTAINNEAESNSIISAIKSSLSTVSGISLSVVSQTLSKLFVTNIKVSQVSKTIQSSIRVSIFSVLSKALGAGVMLASKLSPHGVTIYSASKDGNVTGKLSIHNNVVAIRLFGGSGYVRISSSAIVPLFSIKSNVTYTRFSTSDVLTVITVRNGNDANKIVIVRITDVETSNRLLNTLSSIKAGFVDVITQTVVESLTETEKVAVASLGTVLTGKTDLSGMQISALLACGNSNLDLTVLPIVDRLNLESINFLLCDGKDRFTSEDVDIINNLKGRGLL